MYMCDYTRLTAVKSYFFPLYLRMREVHASRDKPWESKEKLIITFSSADLSPSSDGRDGPFLSLASAYHSFISSVSRSLYGAEVAA